MAIARGTHKCEQVTITLVPTADERSFRHVPTTFSPAERTYAWRHFDKLEYMIIPKKISNKEVTIELFVEAHGKGKPNPVHLQKMIQQFVQAKIKSEWMGLKLGGISRAKTAALPDQIVRRGTIEEILGAQLE